VVMLIQAVMLMLWEVKKKKKKMMMIEGYTFLIRLAVTLSLIFLTLLLGGKEQLLEQLCLRGSMEC
jgi:hypothetical protein